MRGDKILLKKMEVKNEPQVKKKDAYDFESSDSETEIPLKHIPLSSKKSLLKPLRCLTPTSEPHASLSKSLNCLTPPKQGFRPSTPKGKTSVLNSDKNDITVHDTGQNSNGVSDKKVAKPRQKRAAKPKETTVKDGDEKAANKVKTPAKPRQKKSTKADNAVKKTKEANEIKEDCKAVENNIKTEPKDGVKNEVEDTNCSNIKEEKVDAEIKTEVKTNGQVSDEKVKKEAGDDEKPQPKKKRVYKKKPPKSAANSADVTKDSGNQNEDQHTHDTCINNIKTEDTSESVNANDQNAQQSDLQVRLTDQKDDSVSSGNSPKKKSPKSNSSSNKKTPTAQKNKSVNSRTVKKDLSKNQESVTDPNSLPKSKPESKGNFQCENCDYSAKRKGDLTKHKKTCRKSQENLNKETVPLSTDQVTVSSSQDSNIDHVDNDHTPATHTQTPSNEVESADSNGQPAENKVTENISSENKSTDHHQAPFTCTHCSFGSENEDDLKKHMEKCQQDKPGSYHCTHCTYKVKRRLLLLRHQQSHGIFVCSQCDFTGTDKEHLDNHSRQEHSQRIGMKFCKLCSRYIKNKVNFEEHMSKCQGRQPLVCGKCNREFKFESNLKMHLLTHAPADEKKFGCDICEYRTNYKANLIKHRESKHDDNRQKDIKCADCDMMFSTDSSLSKHRKSQHSSAHPFQCEECHKTFKSLHALRCHMSVHNPAKGFKCGVEGCDEEFKLKKALRAHHAEAHPQQTEAKKFPCSFDGCNHIFLKLSHLRRHETAHTGERKFKCTWPGCEKGFRYPDNLKVHLRRHTDEKPIKCELCEFTCRQKSSLQWHLKKYHHQGKQTSPSEKPRPVKQKRTKMASKKQDKTSQQESEKSESKEGENVKTEDKSEEVKKASASPAKGGATKQKTKKPKKNKKKKSEGKTSQEDAVEKQEDIEAKEKESLKLSRKSKRKRKSDNVDAEKEHAKDSPKKKRKTKKKTKDDTESSEKTKLPPKKRKAAQASNKKSKKSSKKKASAIKEEASVITEEEKVESSDEREAKVTTEEDIKTETIKEEVVSNSEEDVPMVKESDDPQVDEEPEKMEIAVKEEVEEEATEDSTQTDDIANISDAAQIAVKSEVKEEVQDQPEEEDTEANAENNQSEMSSDDDMDNGLSAIDPYESPVGAPRPPQRPDSPESSEPSPFFSTGSLEDSDMKGMDMMTGDTAAENRQGEKEENLVAEVCTMQQQQQGNAMSECSTQAQQDSCHMNETSDSVSHNMYTDHTQPVSNHGDNMESVMSNTVPVITTRSPMHQPPPPPPQLSMPQTTMSSPMASPQNRLHSDLPHTMPSPANYLAQSPREMSALTSPGYCVSSPLDHALASTMASSIKSPGYPLPSPRRDIPTSYASMGHVPSPATQEAAQQGLYHAPSPANRDTAASVMMSPAGSQPPQSPYTNVSHMPTMTSQGLYPVPSPQVYRAPSPVKDADVNTQQKELLSSSANKGDIMTSGPSMINTPSPVRQAYAGISPSIRTSQADSNSLGSELNLPEADLIGRYMQSYVDAAPPPSTEPRFEPGHDPMQGYLLNKDLSREQFRVPGISSTLPTRYTMECDPRYSTDRNASIVGSGAFTYPLQNSAALDVTDRTKAWVSTPYMTKPASMDTMSSPLFSNPVNSNISKDSYVCKDQFMSKDSLMAEAAAAGMRDYMVRSAPTFPTTQPELNTDSYARYDPSRAWAAARHYSPHKPGMGGLDTHTQTMSNSVKHFPDPYGHQMAPQLPPAHANYRALTPSASPEMFSRVNPAGLNAPPIPNLPYDKFFYPRDPALYRTQAIGSSLGATSNTFLPMNSGAAAATLPSRDYSRNPLYPPQPTINPFNPFMGDKQYMNAAGKLGQPLPGLAHHGERGQFYPGAPGPHTHPDPQGQDPYRRSVIYNMMNRYFE